VANPLGTRSDKNVLRSVQEADLPQLRAWRNDPWVRNYMLSRHQITETEHLAWFVACMQNDNKKIYLFLMDSRPAGFVSFDIIPSNKTAEWGFYARPNSPRGTGLALGQTALQYAFSELLLSAIVGKVIVTNLRSIQFHLRLGFQQEPEIVNETHTDSLPNKQLVFKLLASNWDKISGELNNA
jgi:UDP-4-amino-4,6-dideoxy-N-acetyl-beta-L-altrosamine N-acetyltransferase